MITVSESGEGITSYGNPSSVYLQKGKILPRGTDLSPISDFCKHKEPALGDVRFPRTS